ncbi:putative flavoprotein [Aspergillus heterothallicus]
MGSIERPYDVLIIGAGLSGLCSLYHIRQQFPSWKAKVLEASSVTISYQFSWDKEILQEWDWRETYAPQAETLRYIEYVCAKHDLRRDIQFNTRVKTARWGGGGDQMWEVEDEDGRAYRARFFVSCLGVLSSPTLPAIPGIERFGGMLFHTSRWPRDFDMASEFAGKRVGVIGTWATGIQTITEVAKEASIESLHMREIKARYDETFKQCAETPSGFLHSADAHKTTEVTPAEMFGLWEKRYAEPGFGRWLGVFSDTYTDREANRLYSEFMADKIQARVSDPKLAEALIPKDHGFGLRRVPLESGYFEVYDSPKVHLVNLRETPFERATECGLVTADGTEYELDVMPFGNIPRSIEHAVDVVTQLLAFCEENGYSYVEPSKEAVDEWTEHVVSCSEGALTNEVSSWLTGVNTNVDGKQERTVAKYCGSAVDYRKRCRQCRLAGWKGFVFA